MVWHECVECGACRACPGPKTSLSDAQLTELIREDLATTPWTSEGNRNGGRGCRRRAGARRSVGAVRRCARLSCARLRRQLCVLGPRVLDGMLITEAAQRDRDDDARARESDGVLRVDHPRWNAYASSEAWDAARGRAGRTRTIVAIGRRSRSRPPQRVRRCLEHRQTLETQPDEVTSWRISSCFEWLPAPSLARGSSFPCTWRGPHGFSPHVPSPGPSLPVLEVRNRLRPPMRFGRLRRLASCRRDVGWLRRRFQWRRLEWRRVELGWRIQQRRRWCTDGRWL